MDTFTVNGGGTFSGTINQGVNAGPLSLTKAGTGTLTLSGSNSYTGVTTISEGILSVSILANGGMNSGIGASSNAAGNLVLDGGTLQYTGAGNSTDRLFTLTTNGGTIDASGTGALSFTNTGSVVLSPTNVAHTLILTGTSTDSNTLNAVIVDGNSTSHSTSLNKTGAGTWILSGANTYTGATTGSTGVLLVNRSLASGSTASVSRGALRLAAGPRRQAAPAIRRYGVR